MKHYPGHGRTHTDSHAGIPVVDVPRAVLEEVVALLEKEAQEKGIALVTRDMLTRLRP